MTNNDDLLQKIRKVVREEVKAETEPIRQQSYENGADIGRLVQGQRRLEKEQQEQGSTLARLEKTQQEQGSTLATIKSVVEATAAGQKELQETVATRADVLDVGIKIDKIKKRVDRLEEDAGITHKN